MQYTNPKYTYRKDGVFYFSKQVPNDVRSYYSKQRIVLCLRTKSSAQAQQASKAVLAKLEDYWLKLRIKDLDVPASHLLNESLSVTAGMPTIEDALNLYLDIKGVGRSELFFRAARRNVRYLVTALGLKTLDKYTTTDASRLREWLLTEQKISTSSVARVFASIKAMTNFAINELGLEIRNPFSGVYIPPSDAQKRHAITIENIKKIQAECYQQDDELRHIVALISDTGMRLAEAVGLHQDDLVLDADVPYVQVREHAWRPLKTSTSHRVIPLVGASLWAAQRIKQNGSDYAFPRYTNGMKCNSNSASAALNKWIKQIAGSGNVIHGFRHSFRDRLRAVSAPMDMIDQLGGWSLQSVGQGYGDGYSVRNLANRLSSIILVQ
jgi:integrase